MKENNSAAGARQKFPDDGRAWFRVTSDLLDDPKLNGDCSADVFRFYFRLLAMLSRTRNTTGTIELDRRALMFCAVRERFGAALALARHGAGRGLYTLSIEAGTTVVRVAKWPELQGLGIPTRLEKNRLEDTHTHTPISVPEKPPKPQPKPPAKREPKALPTPFPEPFPREIGLSLVAWGKTQSLSEAEVRRGINAVRDWALAGGHKRTDWEAAVRNGIRRGWAIEASQGAPEREIPRGQAYRSMADPNREREQQARLVEIVADLTDFQRSKYEAEVAAGAATPLALRRAREGEDE